MFTKKIIFLLIISLILTTVLYSQNNEQEKENKKDFAIEIVFGYGQQNSITIKQEKHIHTKFISFEYNDLTLNQSMFLLCPTSIVFYPRNYFGIGFTHHFGIGCFFNNGIFPGRIIIINKFNLVNKFGDFKNKKNWILIELGLNILINFQLEAFFYNNFSIGPTLMIGYEKLCNKKFYFAIGFVFDSSYSEFQFDNIYYKDWIFNFGLESRFRVGFYNKFNKL